MRVREVPAKVIQPVSTVIPGALAPSLSDSKENLPIASAVSPNLQPEQPIVSDTENIPDFSSAAPRGQMANSEIISKPSTAATGTGKAWRRFVSAILKPLSWNLERSISLPHSICLCLVSAWVLLASVRGGLIVGQIHEVSIVKSTSVAPSQSLQTLFDRLRNTLAARRNVRLRTSSMHRTAVVLGFVHPVVLLPAEMDAAANEAEVEHVLRHELAHVERLDDWGNLLQQCIQAALFFHPAIWWITARLSLEREIACDDYVLEGSSRPSAYALTLANVASRMNHCRHSLSPGVSNNSSQLQQRITMILNTNRDRSPRLARSRLGFFTVTTAMLAVFAITAGPRLVLAQSADNPAAIAPPLPPDALVADAAPAAPAPDFPAVESGPKVKTSINLNGSVSIASPEDAPEPPEAPELADAPPAPQAFTVTAVAPAPAAAPAPPVSDMRPMPEHGKRHGSIEERLDRIERILDELQARGRTKSYQLRSDARPAEDASNRGGMSYGASGSASADFAAKRAAEEAMKAQVDSLRAQVVGRVVGEQAAQQAVRALQDSQRTLEEGQRAAERAARDFAEQTKNLGKFPEDLRAAESENSQKAIEALRDARESLQKQIKSIEHQIKQLEEDRNRHKNPDKSDSSIQTPNNDTFKLPSTS